MALSPEYMDQLKLNLGFVYADLWARYRGLLHVLGERGLVVPEHVERQIDEWIDQQRANVWREAGERLKRFFETPLGEKPPAS